MKGIIFDLDGTLIDSMGMYRDISKNYLSTLGIEMDNEIAQKTTTMSLKMSIAYLVDYYKINKSVEEVFEDYRKMVADFYENEVEMKDMALETVIEYRNKGYKLGLGTATNENLLAHVFNRLDIKKYFDVIQTVDGVSVQKGDPEFFRIMADKMGFAPEEIILFDDAPYALRSAKESGMITCAVYDDSAKSHWESSVEISDYSIKSFRDWHIE
ncbi:MAG: HAD family phosphatase [Peptoniphilus sp.]|nr:HAD family phosphatase [Peptoniphilus sp.]